MNQQTDNSLKLYNTAKALMGTAVAPKNAADGYGMYGCALTVNGVAEEALGEQIGGGASTTLMQKALSDTTRFDLISPGDELPGDIVISPTTMGANPATHGHVGIIAIYGILSNNSEDGLLEEQWTLPQWKQTYGVALGFPVLVYRIK